MYSQRKVAATESSLDILSRTAVAAAAGIMAKRFQGDGILPVLPSSSTGPSSSKLRSVRKLEMKRRVGCDDETKQVSSSSWSSSSKSKNLRTEMRIVSKPVPVPVIRPSIIAYAEADSPIDMSLKKSKRKLSSTDLNGNGSQLDESESKRKRPSVITCASRKLCLSCDAVDVDDHFRRSLGLDSYNWVFNQAKNLLPGVMGSSETTTVAIATSSKATKEVPTSTTGKRAVKSKKTDISRKVDEHFAKSLGKSTWMRLKGH